MRKKIAIASLFVTGATLLLAQGMMGSGMMHKVPMMGGMGCPMMQSSNQKVKPLQYTPITNWKDKTKIAQGKKLFLQNCAMCHGINAEGGMGPSLNGSGHVIHHSPKKLLTQINNGGGGMPAFGNKLNKQEQESIVIYLHSLWPKNVQKAYDKKFHIK